MTVRHNDNTGTEKESKSEREQPNARIAGVSSGLGT